MKKLNKGEVVEDEEVILIKLYECYELKPLGLDNRTTLVLSNTRELNRVPSTE